MFLRADTPKLYFESKADRDYFVLTNEVAGLFNDAVICFTPETDKFWAVLSEYRCELTRKEARQANISTALFKKR